MAARRLLIVLVLLLAASIGAAALAPDRRGSLLPEESSSSTTTTSTAVEPTGAALTERLDASPDEPETVRAEPGDQLALTVGVPDEPGRTIAIDDFGVTEFAEPEAPARFDLLLRDAGSFAITDERGDVVGRIVVSAGSRDAASEAPGAGAARPTPES